MRTVTPTEASTSLPRLLEEAKDNAVVICDDKNELGALVSMEDYEIVRRAKAKRLLASFDDLHAAIAQRAEADGMSLDEVEQRLLAD